MPAPNYSGNIQPRVVPGTRIMQEQDGKWVVIEPWEMPLTSVFSFINNPAYQKGAACTKANFTDLTQVKGPEVQEQGAKARVTLRYEGFLSGEPPNDQEVERWRGQKSSVTLQPGGEFTRGTYSYFHDVVTFEYEWGSRLEHDATRFSPTIEDPTVFALERADDIVGALTAFSINANFATYCKVVEKSGFVSQVRTNNTWKLTEYHTKEIEPVTG